MITIPDKLANDTPNQSHVLQPQAGRVVIVRRWFSAIHALGLILASVARPSGVEAWWLRQLYIDWPIWLVALQLVGLAVFLVSGGWSATLREKVATGATHLLLFAIAALYFFGWFEYALIRFLEIALRLVVGGLWLFALAGLPWVAHWLWRRTRGQRRELPLAKWWFSALVVLATAEPLAAVVERRADALSLPGRLAEPGAGELRVVAVGGSTMLGYPYEPKFGIAQVVGWRLGQLHPGRRIVVQNLAKPGANLRQAVQKLGELTVRPHLLLLYSGHNEFYHELEEAGQWTESPFDYFDGVLSWSPTFTMLNQQLSQKRFVRSLRTGERRLVDRPIAPGAAYSRRVVRFRRQLEQLAEFCERQQIPAVWFVPAASEADFEPNRSVAGSGVTDAERAKIEQLYSSARELELAQVWVRAADAYRGGLDSWPGLAEFHFRLAECLVRLGRHDEARTHFSEALEQDAQPIRADRMFRRQVAEIAGEHSIPLIDAADVLRPHTPFAILDRSVFHDEVHPTPRAVLLLAEAAVERIEEAALFGPPDIDSERTHTPSLADAIAELDLGAEDLATAYFRIGNHFQWLGRMRFESERRERDAAQCLDWARRLRSGEIQPGEDGTAPLR